MSKVKPISYKSWVKHLYGSFFFLRGLESESLSSSELMWFSIPSPSGSYLKTLVRQNKSG